VRVPEGFEQPQPGVLVRRGFEADVRGWLERARETGAHERADHTEGGRGRIARVPLRDGAFAYVRRYRHGGLLGDLLGEAYFDRPPRPWRELAATEAARVSGVEAPEVLAAIAEPLGPAWLGVPYRGVLVTRSIEGRRSLAAALREAASPEERAAWIESAADTVRRLHAAGIHHPDLNVTNFLVGARPTEPVAVIDFDRATAGAGPVGALARRLAIRRLARSIAKLALPGLGRAECRVRLAAILEGRDETARRDGTMRLR